MSKYSTQLRILIDEINEKYKSNKTSLYSNLLISVKSNS